MYNIYHSGEFEKMQKEQQQSTPAPFDFDAEVARARQEYPAETRHITFVRLGAGDAVEKMTETLMGMSCDFRRWLLQTEDDSAVDLSAEAMLSEGASFSVRDPFSGKGIVVFDDRDLLGRDTGIHPETQKRMALWHEIAHLLVSDANQSALLEQIASTTDITDTSCHDAILGLLDEGECARENLADGIMAAIGLRQGWLSPADVRKAALCRAKTSFDHADISHLTTMTLDKIAASSGGFTALSPHDALALAVKCANLNTPPDDEAAEIRTMRHKADIPTTALARVFAKCAQAPDSHAAYIAARLLAHELDTAKGLMPVERKRLQNLLAGGPRR